MDRFANFEIKPQSYKSFLDTLKYSFELDE